MPVHVALPYWLDARLEEEQKNERTHLLCLKNERIFEHKASSRKLNEAICDLRTARSREENRPFRPQFGKDEPIDSSLK